MDNKKNTSTVKMGYISPKSSRKLKLVATSIAAVGATVIIAINGSTIVSGFRELFGKNDITVPKDKVSISFNVELEQGDTVSDIASKYYTEDTKDVYSSFSKYTRDIEKQNKKSINNIEAGETVEIPVIIDKDNPYYLNILDIQKKIQDIQDNNLWVKYTIKYGDRISNLAMLASGSDKEIYDLTNQIYNKNHIGPKTVINEGEEIWILNPELGTLKQQLNDAVEQLRQSLIQEQVKK